MQNRGIDMLAKLYRSIRLTAERMRIARFRAGEAVNQQRILREILSRRLSAFALFLVLAASTTILDLTFADRVHDLGWPNYLEARTHMPTADSLTTVASALAVAVATVTGLLFSISLVVLQNAGERYGGRFVRYLITEPVTRYLQDLLFLTFLFSLWTLAILVTLDQTPFFTLGLASVLGLIAILSLPVYREHTLSFLIPSRSITGLAHDLGTRIRSVPTRERPESRSVTNYLRTRASERIDDLRSFIRPLLGTETQDTESAIHLGSVILSLATDYASAKHKIAESSGWFAATWNPVPENERFSFVETRRMFDQLGLGRPATQQYDLDWVERELFGVVTELTERSISVGSPSVAGAVLSHLAIHMDTLVDAQAKTSVNMSLKLGEGIVAQLSQQDDWAGSIINYAARLASPVTKVPDESKWTKHAISMLTSLPSERAILQLAAPIEVEKSLLGERSKLQLETALFGRVVTPKDWYSPEVNEMLSSLFRSFQRDVFSSAIRCLELLLARNKPETNHGVAAVYCVYLLWHRCLQHKRDDLEVLLPAERRRFLGEAFAGSRTRVEQNNPDEWENPLLDEVTSCCLLMILADKFEPNANSIDPLVLRLLMPFPDIPAMLDAIHRLQAVAGLALLVSEVRQRPALSEAVVARIVKVLGTKKPAWDAFLQRWDMTLNPWLAFQFGLQESLIMKYHAYFYTVWQEVQAIPEVPVNDGGIGWRTELDHQSEFVKRHNIYGTIDPNDCVKELTERLRPFQPTEDQSEPQNDSGEGDTQG